MKLIFVLTVLLSFLGKAFSDETAPVVATLYSGPVSPVGIWSDASGNIYGCETDLHSVFKVTSGAVKTDFAGTRGTAGVASEGVLALNALFNSPRAVWGDEQFLYVTDSVNNRIRRVSWTTSLVTTVVGGGTGSILTSGSFPGTSVALTLPNAIAGSSNGKIYFAEFEHVYVLNTETGLVGMVSFIAGGGDRIGTFAHGAQVSLKDIQGLAVDPTNNHFLFVADSGNKVVRKMNVATGHSMIFAGRVKKENFLLPSKPFENGEAAYKVKFGNPSSVWVSGDGTVFIADSLYHTISVVRHNKIYLFAGKWSSGAISNPLMTGPANQVEIEASHIFGDSSRGVLYHSDGTRGGIQQISPLTVNVYAPTATPTVPPTQSPTVTPTVVPTAAPTVTPTENPTEIPTTVPTCEPSRHPTSQPTSMPTSQPTGQPVGYPSRNPTSLPTIQPSEQPSSQPTSQPSSQPTSLPTLSPPPLIAATSLDSSLIDPLAVWADPEGTIFVAAGHVVHKQAADGTVSVFVDFGQYSTQWISGLWSDSDNLYYSYTDGTVRAVNFVSNEITTIAGGGSVQISTDPQPATDVSFDPVAIWGDGTGSLYILTDREVLLYSMTDLTIQLLAYSQDGKKRGSDGSPVDFLDLARPRQLEHMTGDANRGCLYISERYDSRFNLAGIVRQLDLRSKTATIFAGQWGEQSIDQYTDGSLATDVKFAYYGPAALWAARDGTLFVADLGTFTVSAINPYTKEIRWFAGTWMDGGEWGFRADQDEDNELNIGGPATLGKIFPFKLAGNSQLSTLYILDDGHSAFRTVSPLCTSVSLFPSPLISATNFDSSLEFPSGVWADASGNVFVGSANEQIYKQSADGTVAVFIDLGGYGGGGLWGDSDNLYVCDTNNDRIRTVNFVSSEITTIAGGGSSQISTDPQPATDVSFDPVAIWGDGEGNLYILTDREVLLYSMTDQTIQLLAYSLNGKRNGADGSSVGFLDLPRPRQLEHMAGDANRKYLYVSERYDRAFNPAAIVRQLDLRSKTAKIFAGQWGVQSNDQYTDGVLATTISFSLYGRGPSGLWVGDDGTVFVADSGTAVISAIDPFTKEIRWFAGTWNDGGRWDLLAIDDENNELNIGGPAKQGKIEPFYLTGNSQSNTLYVVDQTHSAVRKISPVFSVHAPPIHRKLGMEEIVSSSQRPTPNANVHLRGSWTL
jgi:sugar lactone lactonase YvrE